MPHTPIAEFLVLILDKGQAGVALRQKFYKKPTKTMEDHGVTDPEDQLVICSVREEHILDYIETRHGQDEADYVLPYFVAFRSYPIGPHKPLPEELDPDTDPWEGQDCGSETPCDEMRTASDDREMELRAFGGWGSPRRSVRRVIPGKASPGRVRLVISGEGLRKGNQIVLVDKADPSKHYGPYETDLYCERVFALTFIGKCIDIEEEMRNHNYKVIIVDKYGDLPEITETPIFKVR